MHIEENEETIYRQSVEYIHSLQGRGIVPGLSAMRMLCNRIGNPQDKIKTIHIAGTNGKGSVGAYISSILINAGYNVGRYVSPAVNDNLEIYQYNDNYISKEDYSNCVEIIKEAMSDVEKDGYFPTAFEAETAVAFLYFNMKNCDYAVIECGMGGRLDATNVIKSPQCSVITAISMDHTAFLGNSIEEIAKEKAGIIKSKVPVASAFQTEQAMQVIQKTCKELSAECVFVKEVKTVECGINGIDFIYKDLELHTVLAGLYQAENAALAIEAVKLLGEKISDDTIIKGIENAYWGYRFEICGQSPYWILDGAHNPDGAECLLKTLEKYFPNERIIYIFGVFKDKDYDKMAKIISKKACRIYAVTPPSNRGLDSKVLAQTVKKYNSNVVAADSIDDAIRMCNAEKCGVVVCFGSLSFLKIIKNKKGF